MASSSSFVNLLREHFVEETGEFFATRYTRRVVRPLTIIVGQLAFVALVLTFLLAIHARGYLLPPRVFRLNSPYPQYQASYTYAVTLVSHLLALASSYLFSQAVLYLMQVYFAEPMSVAAVGFWVSLSKRDLIFERRQTIWTALLTPTDIVIHTPLNGSEIDLSSPLFNDEHRFQEIWNGTNGIETWLKSFRSVTSNSGAISADSNIGLDFGNWTYFGTGTTRGILPADYSDPGAPHSTWLVTSNTKRLPPIGSGEDPDRSITMTQQGLFADVSCKHRHLDEKTNPPLSRNRTHVDLPALNGQEPYHVLSIASVCPNGKPAVLIDLSGKYGNSSMVCTVIPQIMKLDVTYFLDARIIYYDSDDEPTQIEPAHPWVLFAAMQSINDAFKYGQTAAGNVIGDTLFVDFDSEHESYLAGVVSFTGTAMKSRLASKNGSFVHEPPADLVRNINGTLSTPCTGWKNHLKPYLMLLPIMLVAFASIALVVFAEYKSGFKGIPSEHADFNPANPMQLMAAASAGGMPDAFGGLSEEGIKRAKRKRLQLGNVDGRIGLCDVHAG
ncbi:hypothetical protein FB45DRAFT_866819 [Roridomyces roridus]|uniref:Uncharacterized protein n=1 Tax=Roridomyces roridus TaxID=1738132 RepID=A0AAD7BU93_9AGAR|nr:hypothetical protein FB45DRAFT_866819 [Roridomyces roridus]